MNVNTLVHQRQILLRHVSFWKSFVWMFELLYKWWADPQLVVAIKTDINYVSWMTNYVFRTCSFCINENLTNISCVLWLYRRWWVCWWLALLHGESGWVCCPASRWLEEWSAWVSSSFWWHWWDLSGLWSTTRSSSSLYPLEGAQQVTGAGVKSQFCCFVGQKRICLSPIMQVIPLKKISGLWCLYTMRDRMGKKKSIIIVCH